MNSKRILAAVLAATLSVSAVSVVAFADDPATEESAPEVIILPQDVEMTSSSAVGYNDYYYDGPICLIDSTLGKEQYGNVSVSKNKIEYTPSYYCYGSPADIVTGKHEAVIDVVTNIPTTGALNPGDSGDGMFAAVDKDNSQISSDNVEFYVAGGNIGIKITVNPTEYSTTKKLVFTVGQGKNTRNYSIDVVNKGQAGTEIGVAEKYWAEVNGLPGAKVDVDGNNVTITIPDDATTYDIQHAKYIVHAQTTINGKQFYAHSPEYFVLTHSTQDGAEWTFGGFTTNASIVDDTLEPYFVAPWYQVKVVVKTLNYGQTDPLPDAEDPTEKPTDKPTDNKTGKKITIKGGAMEGDALNELIFNALGIKSWDEIETIKFTSDKPFSVQFSTNDGGWFKMTKSAARYEDDELSTEWTLGKDELATLDTTKNGGAYVKIDSGEKEDFDVYIEATLKKAADTDTSKDNTGDNKNPSTGIALAIAPVVLAAGAVIAVSVSKKRK